MDALPGGERRAWPRARVRPGVKVEIIGRGCVVTLTNVGSGGFAIVSDEMLASVARREFRFTIVESDWSVVLPAQMAYCLLRPRPSGIHRGRFLTGFTFGEEVTADVRQKIVSHSESTGGQEL